MGEPNSIEIENTYLPKTQKIYYIMGVVFVLFIVSFFLFEYIRTENDIAIIFTIVFGTFFFLFFVIMGKSLPEISPKKVILSNADIHLIYQKEEELISWQDIKRIKVWKYIYKKTGYIDYSYDMRLNLMLMDDKIIDTIILYYQNIIGNRNLEVSNNLHWGP